MQASREHIAKAFFDLAQTAYGKGCVADVLVQDTLDPLDRHAYRVDIVLTDATVRRGNLSMIQLNRDAAHWLEVNGIDDLAVITLAAESERAMIGA